MVSERHPYAAPSIASFSEAEIMEKMGTATQYAGAGPGLDSAPTDPTSPSGGSNTKAGSGRSKLGKN